METNERTLGVVGDVVKRTSIESDGRRRLEAELSDDRHSLDLYAGRDREYTIRLRAGSPLDERDLLTIWDAIDATRWAIEMKEDAKMTEEKRNDLLATVAERLREAEKARDAEQAQLTRAEGLVYSFKQGLARCRMDVEAHQADLVAVATTGECDRFFGFAALDARRARMNAADEVAS